MKGQNFPLNMFFCVFDLEIYAKIEILALFSGRASEAKVWEHRPPVPGRTTLDHDGRHILSPFIVIVTAVAGLLETHRRCKACQATSFVAVTTTAVVATVAVCGSCRASSSAPPGCRGSAMIEMWAGHSVTRNPGHGVTGPH